MINAMRATVPLPDLLGQIGSEFAMLADDIRRLQKSLSGVLGAAAADHIVLEQAQSLDRVQQYASQLAQVVTLTALQAPHDRVVTMQPVLAGVSLSALAQRLSGAASDHIASGEIELL